MRSNIDEFIMFRSAIFLRGWCERAPGWKLELILGTNEIPLLVVEQERGDLKDVFGEEAQQWGFEASALVGKDIPPKDLRLILRSSLGEESISLSVVCFWDSLGAAVAVTVSALPDGNREVFAPCVAAALYSRAAFNAVGGFDESFCA